MNRNLHKDEKIGQSVNPLRSGILLAHKNSTHFLHSYKLQLLCFEIHSSSIFRIFNLFHHKNIHIPLVASTYVVFATTTATASNNYSAGIIHRVCNEKKYFHIVGLAYIRVMELWKHCFTLTKRKM